MQLRRQIELNDSDPEGFHVIIFFRGANVAPPPSCTKKQTFFKTKEYREKMSQSKTGEKRSEETKKRISNYAKNRTPEHKAKIAETKRRNKEMRLAKDKI